VPDGVGVTGQAPALPDEEVLGLAVDVEPPDELHAAAITSRSAQRVTSRVGRVMGEA
jgi:hypothetical protein